MKIVAISFLIMLHVISHAKNIDGKVKAQIKINTRSCQLEIKMTYRLMNGLSPDNTCKYYLSSQANIEAVSAKGLVRYSVNSTTKPEQTLTLYFDPSKGKKKPLDIDFEYILPFDSALFKQHRFIELGLDWFWFPVNLDINNWLLDYDLLVSIDIPGFKLFSNGKVNPISPQQYRVTSIYPDFDIDLFILENGQLFRGNNPGVTVAGDSNNPKLKDSIAHLTSQVLSFYKKIFGPTTSSVTAVLRPLFDDPNAFGYSRKGYFVLSETKQLASIQFYVAHELAHFWFLNGEPTENAWLTESFAEYSALLLTRQLEGDSVFKKLLQEKTGRLQRIKDGGKTVPPIYKNGTKNKNILSQIALYHKGPLILDSIRKLIGYVKIEQIMKTVFRKRIRTTEEFLNILRQAVKKKEFETLSKLVKESN